MPSALAASIWFSTASRENPIPSQNASTASTRPSLASAGSMGSGEIVSQLTEAGLVDEYQVVTVPIVIGQGRSLFDGVTTRPRLKLTKSRSFQNGNVVSWYSAW